MVSPSAAAAMAAAMVVWSQPLAQTVMVAAWAFPCTMVRPNAVSSVAKILEKDVLKRMHLLSMVGYYDDEVHWYVYIRANAQYLNFTKT